MGEGAAFGRKFSDIATGPMSGLDTLRMAEKFNSHGSTVGPKRPINNLQDVMVNSHHPILAGLIGMPGEHLMPAQVT